MDNKFTSKDYEKLVELLNLIATKGTFSNLDIASIIQFTRLLNWSQTELLPKIEAHRFEVVSVTELDKTVKPTKSKGK